MGIIAYLLIGLVIGIICTLIVKYGNLVAPWPTVIPIVGVVLWLLVGVLYVFGGMVDAPMPRLR